jgi:hypothetical protein
MTMVRTIAVQAVILGLTTVSATAEDYTFTGHIDNTWNNRLNWDPNDTGPPGAGDKATIPDGRICRVEEDDQEAHQVVVEEGGTLGIVSKDLTIGEGSGMILLPLDGTLYFKTATEFGPGAPTPRLLTPGARLDIQGTGLVTARRADGYGPGRIEGGELSVYSGATLAGSLQIYTNGNIVNDGTFVVDGSTDDMYVGRLSSSGSLPYLMGDGSFRVSNGTMHFGYVWLHRYMTAYWEVSDNGEMHVSEYVVQRLSPLGYPRILVSVSGGRLYVNTYFLNRRGLDFTGGEIEVGAGKLAEFNYIAD